MKKVIIFVKHNNGFASATEVNKIDMRDYAETLPDVMVLNVDANASKESVNEYVAFIAGMNGLAKSKGATLRVVNEVTDIKSCNNICKLIKALKKLGITVVCKETKAIKFEIKECSERACKAYGKCMLKQIKNLHCARTEIKK